MESICSCIWITGFPSSGKTTIAMALYEDLKIRGIKSFVLDGDAVRAGLSADLGMSPKNRSENIRRAGELAKLFSLAGVMPICAFVSPYEADRNKVKALFPTEKFILIYLSTPIEVCMKRDVKGLYLNAQSGHFNNMTGIDSPYELPIEPDIVINTAEVTLNESIFLIKKLIAKREGL
jgi:adenylylsulfate kinase